MHLRKFLRDCRQSFSKTTAGTLAVIALGAGLANAADPIKPAPELGRNIFTDGDFKLSTTGTGETIIPIRTTFGPWTVDLGNIGLHAGQFETPPGNSNVIDLNGNRAGSLYQTIDTVPGQTCVVQFLMSGNWTTNPTRPRALSLRFGSQRVPFSMARSADWAPGNMGWQIRTAEFVASSIRTGIRFSSDNSGLPDGAVICRVDVREKSPLPDLSIPSPFPCRTISLISFRTSRKQFCSANPSSGTCRLVAMVARPVPRATGIQVPTSARKTLSTPQPMAGRSDTQRQKGKHSASRRSTDLRVRTRH